MTQFSRKKIISQAGGGGSSSDSARITTLENNEYKVTYYEIISGASGSLTLPTGATINAGEFGLSGNCILSKIDGSNKPTFESPKTAGGTVVTASLNETTGAWVASGTYTDSNVALIYSIKIKAIDYHNLTYDYIVETVDVGVAHLASPTFTGTVTTPAIIVSSETASRVAIIDATSNVKSADTATYPSLTELSYVKGVTSAIQTQLDGKLNAINMFLTNGNQTTTSNVASNITDLVSPTLTANKLYDFEGHIYVSCNNTGGVKFQITIPTGATIAACFDGSIGSNATFQSSLVTASSTLTGFNFIQFNGSNIIKVKGQVLLGGTAGTIQFGFASGINTQTSTVNQLGTHLTLTQIN